MGKDPDTQRKHPTHRSLPPFLSYLPQLPPLTAPLLPSSLGNFTILVCPFILNPEKSNKRPQMSSEKKRNPERPALLIATPVYQTSKLSPREVEP